MKNFLLCAGLLLTASPAVSQKKYSSAKPAGTANMAELLAQKYAAEPTSAYLKQQPQNHAASFEVPAGANVQEKSLSPSSTSVSWKKLSGSMNCYGQIVSGSKPLQYNARLNAVSYVHRKSTSYQPSPAVSANAESGVIVTEISTDFGNTWDSTCIWSNATNWGRYPQGAIYRSPMSTDIANAYFVGSGPVVAGSNFTGNFYASKKLAAPGSALYNNIADPTVNAQQFLSFTSPTYAVNQAPHSWSRYGFTSTEDGVVRSLGLLQKDNTTLGDAAKMRGVTIVKGSFNAGTFTWSQDSIIPSTILKTNGAKVLSSDVRMAFDTAGKTGYIMMLGAQSNATLSNKGFQPIIYKTTDRGNTWASIPGLDFNSPSMTEVTRHLAGVKDGNDTIALPYFTNYDLAVDSAGKLHIGAIICSGAVANNDSLNFIAQFTLSTSPGFRYAWGHRTGLHPYLYDFISDGASPWAIKVVDSLTTEDPGAAPASSGFTVNPWDATGEGGTRINMDPRLQLGRTPNGKYITFSWTESDTSYINHKFNTIPNIKTRCISARGAVGSYSVSANKINVSKPLAGQGVVNFSVSSRATLHYMSPTTGVETVLTSGPTSTVDIFTPFTVTNNFTFEQLISQTNWYGNANLSYEFAPGTVGIKENSLHEMQIGLYPNPANDKATLSVYLNESSDVGVSIYNIVGQQAGNYKLKGNAGENIMNIDVNHLNTGIYFVKLQVKNSTITKKLVVE